MTTASHAQVAPLLNPRESLRGHVVRGTAILLSSNGVVAVTNLLYNLLVARMLGAVGFGHVAALYTLLMLVTAITLSFQIVTSKFIARVSAVPVRAQIYRGLLRRAWQVGVGVAALIAVSSMEIKSFLQLPAQHDLVLLAIAAGIYVPLGVRRGKMQGCYEFGALAINVVVEVAVKLSAALFFLYFGFGVTGVIIAIVLSILAAYAVGKPGPEYRGRTARIKIAPFGEGMQAILYFIGQVILSNLDVLLVKHFFPPAEAGIYAAVALVGRVVFILSWSVVSSMFPVSASSTHPQGGRSVLYTALLLVGGVTSLFITAVALAPGVVWTMLLGKAFLLISAGAFSSLLTEYAVMTTIYCLAVVVMMYEISRRIGIAAWVHLGASALLGAAIWFFHRSLSQVILVQMIVMVALLVVVFTALFRESAEELPRTELFEPLHRLRPVSEEEIIAEFLRGEFYHPEYDPYRHDFQPVVEVADLGHPDENFIRRALLFRRRGRLWRELPPDTEWWEIELTTRDLPRLRTFPRNEWKRFAGGSFDLAEMLDRVKGERLRGRQSRILKKLEAIASELPDNRVPNAVLLIGTDECHSLTIIEGNHRMMAAMLTVPESAHRTFRFYCGLSTNMDSCCWHKTDLKSVTHYARHLVRYFFHDSDLFTAARLRERLSETETSCDHV